MTFAINPSPLFLGSSDFCLSANSPGASLSKGIELSEGTEVNIEQYSRVAASQYWS